MPIYIYIVLCEFMCLQSDSCLNFKHAFFTSDLPGLISEILCKSVISPAGHENTPNISTLVQQEKNLSTHLFISINLHHLKYPRCAFFSTCVSRRFPYFLGRDDHLPGAARLRLPLARTPLAALPGPSVEELQQPRFGAVLQLRHLGECRRVALPLL